MIELFFCLILHTQCSILISRSSNEIKNSTTKFESVVLHSSDISPFFVVERSNITISRSEIVTSIPLISSTSSSSIIISSISLKKATASLIQSNSDTITLEGSNFNDLAIPGEGTFISSGYCREQSVINCVFLNLSRGELTRRHKEEIFALADKGFLQNSLFEKSEDTFYAFIITGPTVMTLNEFKCMNSSFIGCVRNRDPPKRIPRLSFLPDGTCSGAGGSDCSVTSQLYNNSIGTSTISFTNAVFTGCTHTYYDGGGGLYIACSKDPRGTLEMTSCFFNRCTTAPSDKEKGGGGVMVQNAKLLIISTNFTNCSSSQYGGAFFWYYSSTFTTTPFQSCIFCNNTATSGGADLCRYVGQQTSISSPFDGNCKTYNTATNLSGFTTSSAYTNKNWITSSGTECTSDSSGEGEGSSEDGGESGEVVYDIDDVTIDECPSDDGDPTPGKSLYVSTDGAETSNCGKNRESDPLCIHGMIVLFVTDVFLASIYQVKLHCHDNFSFYS